MHRYAQPLKIASFVVAGLGYLIGQELQRRETEEAIERVIERREAEKANQAAE